MAAIAKRLGDRFATGAEPIIFAGLEGDFRRRFRGDGGLIAHTESAVTLSRERSKGRVGAFALAQAIFLLAAKDPGRLFPERFRDDKDEDGAAKAAAEEEINQGETRRR